MGGSDHELLLGLDHGGQHVDTVGREVSSLPGPLIDAMRPARIKDLFARVLVQHNQVSPLEAEEGGLVSTWAGGGTLPGAPRQGGRGGPTGVGVVLERDHKLGPLPETFQEGDNQVPDVLSVTGGEGVLVTFDGRQREALTLKFASSGKSQTDESFQSVTVTDHANAAVYSSVVKYSLGKYTDIRAYYCVTTVGTLRHE